MRRIIITEGQLSFLFEGVNEQGELRRLVEEVIDKFSKENLSVVKRVKRQIDSGLHVEGYFNNDYISLVEITDGGLYDLLGDFIKNSSVNIVFYEDQNERRKGYYDGNVKIKYNKDFEDSLVYQVGFYEKADDISSSEAKQILKKAMGISFRSTLIHELQHAYDAYRSGGKYRSDRRSVAYYNKRGEKDMSDEEYQVYLKLPHEYWARFSQTMADIFRDGMSFEELLDKFKSSVIMRFDSLRDGDKRRILKALYGYWDLHKK
jgi:hypothetical protein